jgi:hypothetical protein
MRSLAWLGVKKIQSLRNCCLKCRKKVKEIFQNLRNYPQMTQEFGEAVALKALVWLLGNEEILPLFMGSTGLGEDELRARLAEVEFLSGVLDFMMMNDEWVKECAVSTGLDPYDFMRARQSLPGGEAIHWT